MKITIAIDGPAGAGKSTVAKILADRLGLLYIDTGAMYRAATWLALKEQIDLEDGESLAEALSHKDLRLESPEESDGGRIRVFLNDHEITDAIRGKDVSDRVSTVAAQKMVRKVLVEQQRKLAGGRSAVLDGRDIGTVVLP
ncbi:MAG TPA: (d)CMP kinase, partial [Candidatus Melainabacteria bacterium]|nr:(d)CMP kinase [Candidatus Melainabacteria bacterium]